MNQSQSTCVAPGNSNAKRGAASEGGDAPGLGGDGLCTVLLAAYDGVQLGSKDVSDLGKELCYVSSLVSAGNQPFGQAHSIARLVVLCSKLSIFPLSRPNLKGNFPPKVLGFIPCRFYLLSTNHRNVVSFVSIGTIFERERVGQNITCLCCSFHLQVIYWQRSKHERTDVPENLATDCNEVQVSSAVP